VAVAAELVELGGGQLARIDGMDVPRIARVGGGWAVTGFAADTCLVRLDGLAGGQRDWAGGVAGEAAQNAG
jgi:hypothetical protein